MGREEQQAIASAQLQAAEATAAQLREVVAQANRERAATEAAAAAHVRSLEQAVSQVDGLQRELMELRISRGVEARRAEVAATELARYRGQAEEAQAALALAREAAAQATADVEAMGARLQAHGMGSCEPAGASGPREAE